MNESQSVFFAEMALDLHAEPTAERTVNRIAEYAKIAISCNESGIMLVHARNRIETAAATSKRVGESHNLQIFHDEGPCLDAIEQPGSFLVNNTATDARWPKWGPAVAELGLLSALCIRLETKDRRYGSLNLYADHVDAFDADALAVAEIFARHASVALAAAHSEEGLQLAVDARKLIGQAQGILMERFDIDPERAFDVLRRFSQAHNVKLREVARQVVENRQLPAIASAETEMAL
ncbi:MAG: GAF and ANTAR domain-containing protein [Actinomycetota bacterium]|nr:GAF and ANTAR domain-containing protein [Actinomycetota bacterium]